MIGEGGFSKVYDVVNKVDQCHYAVKQVVLETSQEANLEVALYKVMRGRNV
jgi:serine/threonine protein kinase